MTLTTALLFAVFVMTATMPTVLMILWMHVVHSRHRNELWRIRDSLVDDVLENRISRTPGIDLALKTVETHIRVAGRHSLSDLILAMAVYRGQPVTPIQEEIRRAGVREADAPRLQQYLNSLWATSSANLFRSSIPGLLVLLAGRLIDLASPTRRTAPEPRQRAHRQFRARAEPIELTEIPDLVRAGDHL
ncbi:hypothetical protein [Actinoplanes sp. NPDC048796]|uniref:hypothetical protein n=1 Tax=unclassified Actinoplanes TaxID=2626549 RepID=UPI0033F764F4